MSKFLKAFLFASVIFAPFAASAVTVASWGGAYTESQQKAYADTYSDPGSIVFESYNGGLGEVRAQVESGSVTWDLVDVLPGDAITGCDEGLFEDISDEIASMGVPGPDGESSAEDEIMDLSITQVGIVVFHKFSDFVVFYDPDAFLVKNQIAWLISLMWKNFQVKVFTLGQLV